MVPASFVFVLDFSSLTLLCHFQDSINNNSLGKKDSWKDSHSSSPHITGEDSTTKEEKIGLLSSTLSPHLELGNQNVVLTLL